MRQQGNHWKVYENLINKGSGFEQIYKKTSSRSKNTVVQNHWKARSHLVTGVSTGPIWSIMLVIINQWVMNITGSLLPIIVVSVKSTGYYYCIKKKPKLNMIGWQSPGSMSGIKLILEVNILIRKQTTSLGTSWRKIRYWTCIDFTILISFSLVIPFPMSRLSSTLVVTDSYFLPPKSLG